MRLCFVIALLALLACGNTVGRSEIEWCAAAVAADSSTASSLRALFAKRSSTPSLCAEDMRGAAWRLRVAGSEATETEIWMTEGKDDRPQLRWRRLELDSTFHYSPADSGTLLETAAAVHAVPRLLRRAESGHPATTAECVDCATWVGERKEGARVLWSRLEWLRLAPEERQLLRDLLTRTER